MKNKLNIKLYLYSDLEHTSQIITGYIMLKKSKFCNLEIIDRRDNGYDVPHLGWIEAEIDGKLIAYDVLDGYNFNQDKLLTYIKNNNICAIFKRSFSEVENKNIDSNIVKIMQPLGFNYYVSCLGNPLNRPHSIKSFIHNWKHYLFGITFSKHLESNKNKIKNNKPIILFQTRLWDPNEVVNNKKLYNERIYINKMRIEVIRKLRSKYPEHFIGGVQDNEYARKECPDLILGRKYTIKKVYLKTLKKANICIGSMGLHKSVGWKTAEYIVAGKAIINEKLYYCGTGDFIEDKNYLSYSSAEECIKKVDYLYNNQNVIKEMSKNNVIYYDMFLRPDILILNSLKNI